MSGFDFTKAAGQGTATIDRNVLGMPFLNIIQKGSPEFDETHPKFREKKLPDCRPGNILFEPERAIIAQPMQVIPLAQTALYTEWKPNKGGFAGNRTLDVVEDRNYRKGVPGTPTEYREYLGQNELVYTIYFMVLFLNSGKWKRGMIAFTSTQLKVARNWLRTVDSTKLENLPDVKAPIFAKVYKVSTFADSNSKGGYFSWVIEGDRMLSPTTDQELLEMAFDASSKAIRELPKPMGQPALTSGSTSAQHAESAEAAPY